MTITLKPETEAKLMQTAEREGREPDALADALLAETLAQRESEFAGNVKAIQEGFNAIREGRERPFAEFMVEHRHRSWGMFVVSIVLALITTSKGFCAPPIRCVHQTTVIKDGKPTTHLILTTAKPGEMKTTKNTANIVYPGLMGSIVTNADQSLAAVTFSLDLGPDIYHTSLYLFASTTRQHLQVIPNFQVSVAKALLTDPIRTARNTFVGRDYWSYYGGPKESQPSKA